MFLPQAVEDVLAEWDWTAAVKRAVLAPLAESPDFEWENQYLLPHDFLRPLTVGDGASRWAIENGRVYADNMPPGNEGLPLVYVALPENPNELPKTIQAAIWTRLSALIAPALAGEANLVALCFQEAAAALEKAKREDAAKRWDPLGSGARYWTEERS